MHGSAVFMSSMTSQDMFTTDAMLFLPEQNVIEKTIKITQNAGSNKGFGFDVRGGKENQLPITVHKVSLGMCNYAMWRRVGKRSGWGGGG